MNERQLALLTKRLDRLERENRRWKGVAVLSTVILGSAALMGQTLPSRKVLEAEKFILKDSNGKVRGVLGAEDPPSPANLVAARYGFHLYATDGRKVAALGERPGTTGIVLELHDQHTASSAYLSAGSAHIGTGEDAFRALASLELNATEETREASEREGETMRKKLEVAKTPEEREEVLRAVGSYGVQARLSAFTKGTSQLYINRGRALNSRGAVDLSVTREGQPQIKLNDENGMMRAALGDLALEHPGTGVVERRPVSSLVFFNKAGKVTWKAP